MRVLLIDEPGLSTHLERALRQATLAIDVAHTCLAAADLVIANMYALIVLDPALPDGCGIELLRTWRQEKLHTPVMVLSDRGTVADKVAGLEAGADDYLTKPFAWAELLARVKALLKRRHTERLEVLTFGDLTLDRTRQRVRRDRTPVRLTAREFALLEHLMLHPKWVISRDALGEHVWDGAYEARSNVIDVLIGRLRRKLEAGGRERLIVTVKGMGYALRRPTARNEHRWA